MAIEDAIVLARCLKDCAPDQVTNALQVYEGARKTRTARVQVGSRGNEWLRDGGNADWLYGYDAWNVPLAAESARDIATPH